MKRINEELGECWREYQADAEERITTRDEQGRIALSIEVNADGSIEVRGVGSFPALIVEPEVSNVVIVRMRDRR